MGPWLRHGSGSRVSKGEQHQSRDWAAPELPEQKRRGVTQGRELDERLDSGHETVKSGVDVIKDQLASYKRDFAKHAAYKILINI
jgi:hypothetical protein